LIMALMQLVKANRATNRTDYLARNSVDETNQMK